MNYDRQDLYHWGIQGQRWGIRRYQNPDGTYTEAGKIRYNKKYPYQDPDTGSLNELGQKYYMKAAKKNRLDYERLSDKELDMISNRFSKEEKYNQSVDKYRKSSKMGNKIAKGTKKGSKLIGGAIKGLSTLFLTPISKAISDSIKDAFKDSKNAEKNENKDDKPKNENKQLTPQQREIIRQVQRAENSERRRWANTGREVVEGSFRLNESSGLWIPSYGYNTNNT